jgi:hypothetical protein
MQSQFGYALAVVAKSFFQPQGQCRLAGYVVKD